MITLYLYPELFGLPDNNPFGLKVDTFLRLTKIPYNIEHIVDTKYAPRNQLPYLIDDGLIMGDSNKMIDYLTQKYHISLDSDLSEQQKIISFLIMRMLDTHLYWIMSYSRWQDPQFWPLFRMAFLTYFPQLTEDDLEAPRKHNLEKYHYQGIGRYEPKDIYPMGIDDLQVIHAQLGNQKFLFGEKIHTIDACCYGFLANIFYFEIDTPLKKFMISNNTLVEYVQRIRNKLNY